MFVEAAIKRKKVLDPGSIDHWFELFIIYSKKF